jgi:serine/threonine protein kinase/Tfp pilus assembly protein PilF
MKEEKIFQDAIEQTADQRTAFLLDACGDDVALRERVEVLLKAHANPGSFLRSPAAELTATTDTSSITERPGTVIGPYKLLQQIGEGGMGVVFMAEQTEPIQRTVALKIIKPGMDTRQVVARFEAERQALAMMDHPNIAKVLDAGTTDSGRPYFVMELVKGVPITKYCDEKQLSLRERIDLFTQVCHAVQHAHQKGVIHRDVKPSNVLVAEYDNRAVPKVIDFGVAKATAQKLTERTMFTEFGQVVGTVEYMSPEQAKLNQLDIDTRTDIYSLGVLLYELLTGSTPFEQKQLREAAFDEMLRIIREEEPPKPSTRLSTSDTLPSIAANRHTEPQRLSKEVSGELDWIVMKALEKDRNRRYETASAFAADIERHLRDEPVQAGPPSAAYRFRKFARRNKGALATAAFLCIVLLLGTLISTWQAMRATRAERTAAAEAQKAKTEAAIAQAVNDFVNQDLLEQADQMFIPYDRYKEPTADLKLLTVLDRAAEKLDGRFADQPLVEAALRHRIGNTYDSLGNDNLATLHLQRAVELRVAHLGEEHPDTLTSMRSLAWAKRDPDYMTRVLEIRGRVLGKDHPDTLHTKFLLAMVTGAKGGSTGEKAYIARAIELFRETLDAERKALGEDDIHTAFTMYCLAHTLFINAGKDNIPTADDREIESLYRKALAVFRKQGRDATWYTFDITNRLGEFLNSRHRYEEAETLLQDALKRLESLPGASPEMVLGVADRLEAVYRDWGKPERAAELNRQRSANKTNVEFVKAAELFSQAIKLLPDRWEAWHGRAWAYFHLHQWDNAAADFSKAIELAPEVHTNWLHRGHCYLTLTQWDKAAADFSKLVEQWPQDSGGWFFLAAAHAQLNQPDEALFDLRQAIAKGFNDVEYLKTYSNLDPIRSHADFKKLVTELEGEKKKR